MKRQRRSISTRNSIFTRSSILSRSSFAVALTALLFVPWLQAAPPLTPEPRRQYAKPAKTVVIPAIHETRRIYVKLRDDSGTSVTNGALLPVDHPTVKSLTRALAGVTAVWKPLHSVPATQLARFRSDATRQRGRAMPDLSQEYFLLVSEDANAAAIIDRLNAIETVEIALPVPRPVAPTVPPDLQNEQGYLEPPTVGVGASCMWQLPGGTGTQTAIADIEYSWNLNHGDLPTVTLLGPSPVDPFLDTNHGTAVLGELVAIDNGTGVTGATFGSTAYVVAANTIGGYNVAGAVTTALSALSPGDVIVIEQQTVGPNYTGVGQDGLVPSEWNVPVYNAVMTAVGNGVTVVAAAGNGNEDLDAPEYDAGHAPFKPENDSGAIIVGAGGAPGSPIGDRARLPFSNYGSRIDLQGWGERVTTTGYGDAFSAEGPNQYYTAFFSGTSSATPIVAAACATVQSTYRTGTGTVLSPIALRGALVATGSPQLSGTYPASQHIGPRPDAPAAVSELLAFLDPNENGIPEICEGLPVGCAGYCGGESPDGCFCDNACMKLGDCCTDVCAFCPDTIGCCGNGICNGPESCETCPVDCGACGCDGYCGEQSPDGCFCDEFCLDKGDCCPDLCDDCPDTPGCCGDGTCDSNAEDCATCPADCGMCGCDGYCGQYSPDGCYCDAECIDFNDCCDDVCDTCPTNDYCCQTTEEPANPEPVDAETGVSVSTLLTWQGGAPGCSVVPPAARQIPVSAGDSNIPFSPGFAGRYQQIHDALAVGRAGNVTALRFRIDESVTQSPTSTTASLQLYAGYAATVVSNASPIFENNIGAARTLVYDGDITFLDSETTGAPTFDVVIPLSEPFFYNPLYGDFLIDLFVSSVTGDVEVLFDATDPASDLQTTTRVYAESVDATDGMVGRNGEPFGLVTMLCFDDATPLPADSSDSTTATTMTPIDASKSERTPRRVLVRETDDSLLQRASQAPGVTAGSPGSSITSLDASHVTRVVLQTNATGLSPLANTRQSFNWSGPQLPFSEGKNMAAAARSPLAVDDADSRRLMYGETRRAEAARAPDAMKNRPSFSTALTESTFDFPSAASDVVASAGFINANEMGFFFSASNGHAVSQTFETTTAYLSHLIFSLSIPTNGLAQDQQGEFDIRVNGTKVAELVITPDLLGTHLFHVPVPNIPGPNFTIGLEMTNDIAPGGGTFSLGYAEPTPSSITLLSSEPPCAAATLIDFDDLSAGNWSGSRYAYDGVTFSTAAGAALYAAEHALANTLPTYVYASGNAGVSADKPIIITFEDPVSCVSFQVVTGEISGMPFRVEAFDGGEDSIDLIEETAGNRTIRVQAPDIRRIVFTPSPEGGGIDSLRFTGTVSPCHSLAPIGTSALYTNLVEQERSIAVDAIRSSHAETFEIFGTIGVASDLTVSIRAVEGTVRGRLLGQWTVPVAPGGPGWFGVPVNFTFLPGQRYDIAFGISGGWQDGIHELELFNFNNSSLSGTGGFVAGDFHVLDGGSFPSTGYSNILCPRIRVCSCATRYSVYTGLSPDVPDITCEDQAIPACLVSGLPPGHDVYWRVVARTCCSESTGPLWQFETACEIVDSEPATCAIDARQPQPFLNKGPVTGWNRIQLTMACDQRNVSLEDFTATSGDGSPVIIEDLEIDGAGVQLILNASIQPETWTCFDNGSSTEVCIGYLSGDANNDTVVNGQDIRDLIDAIEETKPRPNHMIDMDRNGFQEPDDLLRLIDLMNGAEGSMPLWASSLPDCPTHP